MAKPRVAETVGDPNNPVQTFVGGYDMRNMPGKKKIELIETGELSIDAFITPPNMPGRKLAALRESHRERVKTELNIEAKQHEKEPNPYKVGDFIVYKNQHLEVLKIEGEKVGFDREKDGELRSVLVPHYRVTKG